MKNILTIIKKEFFRFFKDRRLVLTTVFLPGLLIFVMYSVMGNTLSDKFMPDENYDYNICVENIPESIKNYFETVNIKYSAKGEESRDSLKKKIDDKELDAFVIFPENFDETVATYTPSTATGFAPNVEIYYNSVESNSQAAFSMVSTVLEMYESSLANKFDVNRITETSKYDLATEKEQTGQIFSMLLPMLMMVFLFSGCMAVAPESIAGEKERGTIATLLVTPVKRSELAIGKIVSLSFFALLSGVSSFVGTILSLPKLMGNQIDIGANVYSSVDYICLLFIILSTVLIIISLISIISAFAKSVKEATTLIMPLMLLVMIIGISSMFGNGAPTSFFVYLIPLYNSVQSMNGIFSFAGIYYNVIITVISNLVYTIGLSILLTKMFGSEKIMFSK